MIVIKQIVTIVNFAHTYSDFNIDNNSNESDCYNYLFGHIMKILKNIYI